LRENPELAMQLQAKVYEAVGLTESEAKETEAAESEAKVSEEVEEPVAEE
jgi:hypothetical protein